MQLRTKIASFEVSSIHGKERPRKGKHGKFYTPPATHAFEEEVALNYASLCGRAYADYEGAVAMKIEYTRALPSSRWLKRGDRFEEDMAKPDVDNVFKAIADALNGIAYRDDSQIVDAQIIKHPRHQIERDKLTIRIDYLEGERTWQVNTPSC